MVKSDSLSYHNIFSTNANDLNFEYTYVGSIRAHLRNLHSTSGEPMYPSGQVQTGWCLVTLQFAFGAQGLSSAQGLTHALFLHAAKSGQSSFLSQPTEIG